MPTKFQNPTDISEGLLNGSLKIDDLRDGRATPNPISDSIATDGVATSSSVSVMTFGDHGVAENFASDGAADDTIFCAGSMTKMVTAVTMLRMTEEEKYQQYLADEIDTKLSDILPLLKKYYPDSKYITEELEQQPNFEQITLQHLAQHTSGLSNFSVKDLIGEVYGNVNRRISKDMLDTKKAPRALRYGENIGEHSYNNLGYELLGRTIVAVASEAEHSPKEFGDVVNELVIDRVKEKVGPEKSSAVKFFTADQMEIAPDGKTRIRSHPELRVEFGKHYHDGKFLQVVPSCIYHEMTAGGGYTTPESMSRVVFHILSDRPEFSIFKKPETLEIFNSRQVLVPDGYYREPGHHTYGIGYRSFSNEDQKKYRGHAGLDFGSSSHAMIDTEANKVATTMISFENLTLPLAYALTHKKKSAKPIEINSELHAKTLELSKNYSESQLLEMRNGLEKSYEDFGEKFKAISKQRIDALDLATSPSPTPERPKISRVKGGNFSEI